MAEMMKEVVVVEPHKYEVREVEIPEHENAGVIAKIGKNVKNVKVGDHVIVDLLSSCGTCYQCTHGRKKVCEHVKVRGSGADGGWRQYFTAPYSHIFLSKGHFQIYGNVHGDCCKGAS